MAVSGPRRGILGTEALLEQLAAVAGELADLALERLQQAFDATAGERAVLEGEERRLSQARRAVIRAMAALGGTDETGDDP